MSYSHVGLPFSIPAASMIVTAIEHPHSFSASIAGPAFALLIHYR